jgi:flagellar protein FlbD
MIHLTRLDGRDLVINADMIATVERTPDTMLTLVNGVNLMVTQSVDAVVDLVISYRRRIAAAGPTVRPEAPEKE